MAVIVKIKFYLNRKGMLETWSLFGMLASLSEDLLIWKGASLNWNRSELNRLLVGELEEINNSLGEVLGIPLKLFRSKLKDPTQSSPLRFGDWRYWFCWLRAPKSRFCEEESAGEPTDRFILDLSEDIKLLELSAGSKILNGKASDLSRPNFMFSIKDINSADGNVLTSPSLMFSLPLR